MRNAKMALPSISIFMFALVFGFGFGSDPCKNYMAIDNPYRSVKYKLKPDEVAICDSNLPEGWYRFTNTDVGVEMPEIRPDPFHCGTVAPIWIDGKHPTVINETKSVNACANVFSTKYGCTEIRVKKCESYFVYYLMYTTGCSMAYCAGNKAPCPKGFVGVPPKCTEQVIAKFPEDRVPKPRITYRRNKVKKTFSMICKFDFNRNWNNVSFAVEWFVQGRLKAKETLCRFEDVKQDKCKNRESHLHQDNIRAGERVRCRIKMKYNTHPSNNFTEEWKNSNPYFVGLEVSKQNMDVTECQNVDKEITVNFRPTVPVIQKNHKQTFRLCKLQQRHSNEVIQGQCTYEFPEASTKTGINVTISSICADRLAAKTADHVEYRLQSSAFHAFWNMGYYVSFKVSVKNTESKTCRTHNDPHIERFDKKQYTILRKGTFVFYTNKERDIEIHTRHWQCSRWSRAFCNCGIAIRERDDVIVFSFCNEKLQNVEKYPALLNIRVRSCCPLSKDTRISKKIMGASFKYRVVLPSGTRLTIERHFTHLDIHLSAPMTGETIGGLCSNTNGSPGSNAEFPDSWRLANSKESLFERDPKPQHECNNTDKMQTWCFCQIVGVDKKDICTKTRNDDASYDMRSNQSEKDQVTFLVENSTCKVSRKRRSAVLDNVFQSDDVVLNNVDARFFRHNEIDDGSSSLKHFRYKRSVLREAMSQINATKHCKHALEDSAAGKVCRNISQPDIKRIMRACVNDLKITGDFEFVTGAFGVMKESCERTVFGNLSLYKNTSNGELQPPVEFVKDICPNDCSNHGKCTNRTCICDEGYTTVDCSAEINAVPKLMGIYNEGLCDVRQRPCRKTDLLGKDFVESENLTCHAQEHKVFLSKWEPKPGTVKLRGKLIDLFGVRCDLPDTPTKVKDYDSEGTPASALWISISNDGQRQSQRKMRFISYDSDCMACNITGNCSQKKNTCLINGHCFPLDWPYRWNPKNWCEVCNPHISTDTWTKRTDNKVPSFGSEQRKDHYALIGESLPLQLKATDPDDRPLKYYLISSTANKGYVLSSSGLLQLNVTSQADFTVEVKDECSANDTTTITVHVLKCPCRNGGKCSPHPYHPRGSGQYSCKCPTGFNGTVCETNIDDCAQVNCGNGVCIDGVNNYTCRCNVGFVGSLCDKQIYKCKNDSCYPGVKCNESVIGITCGPCPVGMSGDGKTCTDIDECLKNPCLNGATCANQHGRYQCLCASGFTGNHCEQDVDECLKNPCQNGGSCVNNNGSYTCRCSAGFTGNDCEKDIDECLKSPCQNGATCTNQHGGYQCLCASGFTGKHCEQDIDECLKIPCQNGATCANQHGGYQCQCVSGFTGKHCEQDIDECLKMPCQNGATCANQHGKYQCLCASGFTGNHCEQDVDECLQSPCQNGGSCVNNNGSYACQCSAGFTGADCEKDIDECLKSPCQNGATCTNQHGEYQCQCVSGFTGKHCEQDVNECLNQPCKNNATCVNKAGGYSCQCEAGFTGQICNQDVDECLKSPCQNGGSCVNMIGSYTCHCSAGFTGNDCEKEKKTTEHLSTTKATLPTTKEDMTQAQTLKVEFRLIMDWEDAYSRKESAEFKFLARKLENEIFILYNKHGNGGVKKVRVISMRKGSIIVEIELVFKDQRSDPLDLLRKDIEDGKMGTFTVDPKSLKSKDKTAVASNKPLKKDLTVPLILVGVGIVVLIVIIVVIVMVARNRSHSRPVKSKNDGEELMEMKTPDSKPEKELDVETILL